MKLHIVASSALLCLSSNHFANEAWIEDPFEFVLTSPKYQQTILNESYQLRELWESESKTKKKKKYRKELDAEYQKILDRQIEVREAMQEIFRRKNEGENYDTRKALEMFMFGEQFNGYALIGMEKQEEAIERITEVIETVRKAFNSDKFYPFVSLYRVRGLAYHTMEKLDSAVDDYKRVLDRYPDDPEALRYVEKLPEKFRKRFSISGIPAAEEQSAPLD